MIQAILSALQAAPAAADPPPANAPLALLILLVAAAGWFGLRTLVRGMRAGKAASTVRGNFNDFAREALINAAKIDGRVDERERAAIGAALAEIGANGDVAAAFASARLTKAELVAYLRGKGAAFSRDQKVWLLKALLSVFVSDGRFDEAEHAALVDYTAAIGFDRQSAPGMLREFVGGSVT